MTLDFAFLACSPHPLTHPVVVFADGVEIGVVEPHQNLHARLMEITGRDESETMAMMGPHPFRGGDGVTYRLDRSVKGLGRSYAWETHVNEDRGQLQLWY